MTPPYGVSLAVLGFLGPSLVGLVWCGVLALLRPAWNWWGPFVLLWFLTSLPAAFLAVRGMYRLAPDEPPSMVRAVVVGIPLGCLGVFFGGGVFGRCSLWLGYGE